MDNLFLVGMLMAIPPYGMIAMPLGLKAQKIGLSIQGVGLCVLVFKLAELMIS